MHTEALKIAVITEDGITISQHFGRAPYYLVLTIDNGQVVGRELRDKLGHAHLADEPHKADQPGQPHGFGPAAHDRHMRMAETIADCQALLCGGMGAGAYQSMQSRGVRPVVTDVLEIEPAVKAYLEGKLDDRVEKLH
jgi:predicted Fe-Mo cluster-binding NifX family protein